MVETGSQLSTPDFQYICGLVRKVAAIEIDTGKEYLVHSRLSPLVATASCRNLTEFIGKVRSEESGPWGAAVIDALTTNETLFFRDSHPFEALRLSVIPELIEKRRDQRRLAIWSAAASTGQEAYSLSIMLKERFPQLADWNVEILGTDISPTALEQARRAEYSKIEINRGLAAPLLVRYFRQDGTRWILRDDIRRTVHFRELNLVGPWYNLPTFDLVLLRNVMIYMSLETRRKILRDLRRQMSPDGYLMLGSAENLLQTDEGFEPVELNDSLLYRIAAR